MKTLDRSKPFTEVFGNDPENPYRYVQNGVKFDNQENEIVEKSAEPAKKAADKKAADQKAAE